MQTILPSFEKASVLVIGDIMLDRYWFGETARISPEAPVPIVKINQLDERLGGAGNVALNISALGALVKVIGITGKDEAADVIQTQLTAMGLTHTLLQFDHIPTITKLRVMSRHQQLIRLDFEKPFPEFDPAQLIEVYKEYLKNTDVVILSDYGKGTLRNPAEFIRLAKEASIPVLVDPKGRDFNIYRHATLITPNFKEFETIVGASDNERTIIQKAKTLLKEHDIQFLLLTRGEGGMTLIQQEAEEIHLPAHAREVFDVTGAGDTVIAVLGAALAAKSPLPEAMMLSNLAASLVVGKLGATSVSAPELAVALKNSSSVTSGIVNEEQLLTFVAEARLKAKKIVFTNGCFDILHAGHVMYLQQAKQLGDYLILAINDDESVKRLKGKGRPINNVDQRMAVLASLGMVDMVVAFSDDTPKRLLKKIQPDILVKGGDYEMNQVVGSEIVLAYGGEVRVLGIIKNVSTTLMIDRVIKNCQINERVE